MGNKWSVNSEEPGKLEKYEWRVPNNEAQHVEQTTSPGDLRIKPEDISLKPTISPERSGLQHGADDWDFVDTASGADAWYVSGVIVQDED